MLLEQIKATSICNPHLYGSGQICVGHEPSNAVNGFVIVARTGNGWMYGCYVSESEYALDPFARLRVEYDGEIQGVLNEHAVKAAELDYHLLDDGAKRMPYVSSARSIDMLRLFPQAHAIFDESTREYRTIPDSVRRQNEVSVLVDEGYEAPIKPIATNEEALTDQQEQDFQDLRQELRSMRAAVSSTKQEQRSHRELIEQLEASDKHGAILQKDIRRLENRVDAMRTPSSLKYIRALIALAFLLALPVLGYSLLQLWERTARLSDFIGSGQRPLAAVLQDYAPTSTTDRLTGELDLVETRLSTVTGDTDRGAKWLERLEETQVRLTGTANETSEKIELLSESIRAQISETRAAVKDQAKQMEYVDGEFRDLVKRIDTLKRDLQNSGEALTKRVDSIDKDVGRELREISQVLLEKVDILTKRADSTDTDLGGKLETLSRNLQSLSGDLTEARDSTDELLKSISARIEQLELISDRTSNADP